MGVTFYGTALIGLRVHRSELIETVRVKAFEHDHPDDWEVDPKTGRRLWMTKNQAVFPNDTQQTYEDEWNSDWTLAGYEVVVPQFSGEVEENMFIACLKIEADSWRNTEQRVDLPRSGEVECFREKMIRLHLWNENEFGLWVLVGGG